MRKKLADLSARAIFGKAMGGISKIPTYMIGRRALTGAAYYAGGTALGSYIDASARDYERYYGGEYGSKEVRRSADVMQGIIGTATVGAVVGSAFGMDPVNMVRKAATGAYRTAGRTAHLGAGMVSNWSRGGSFFRPGLKATGPTVDLAKRINQWDHNIKNVSMHHADRRGFRKPSGGEITAMMGMTLPPIALGSLAVGAYTGVNNPQETLTGLGLVGGVLGGAMAKKMGATGLAMTAGIGGAGIGAYYGSAGVHYPAAEGRITSFDSGGSAVRNMNFNTAGLVQALHTNRKMR